jgi:hypothetical protein
MLLGMLAIVLAVVICLNAGNTVVRTICAVPLALVLPGLMLTGAAFPARSLGVVQWVLFSLGLSVIVTVLAGFVLNALPGGLQAAPWAIALCALSVAAGLLAILRRPARVYAVRSGTGVTIRSQGGSMALFGLAGLVLAAAFLVNALAAPSHASTFTQFWLTPAGPVAPRLVHLGIHSEEGTPMRYRVVVTAGAHRLHEWPNVPLASGSTWTANLTVPRSYGAVAVTALLYRLDHPSAVYRMVRWAMA